MTSKVAVKKGLVEELLGWIASGVKTPGAEMEEVRTESSDGFPWRYVPLAWPPSD